MTQAFIRLSVDVDGNNCGDRCCWLDKHGSDESLSWSCKVFERMRTHAGSGTHYHTHELVPVVASSCGGGPVLRHVGCLNSEKHFPSVPGLPAIEPCPYCGQRGAGIDARGIAGDDLGVWCADGGCGAVGPSFSKGEERQAIDAWNKVMTYRGAPERPRS